MKFVCEKCNTKYSISDEKVRRKVLKIRCKNCSNIIVVRDPKRSRTGEPRRTGGARALEQALDGVFTGSSVRPAPSRRSIKAVQSPQAPGLAAQRASEPEEAPTMMSGPVDMGFQDLAHEDEWYLAIEGHQFGPMSFDELCSRAKRGEARGESGEEAFVWRDGFDDWVEIASVPELRPYVPPPPPPRGRSGLLAMSAPPARAAPPPPLPDTPAPRLPRAASPGLTFEAADRAEPSMPSYPGTPARGVPQAGTVGAGVQPLAPMPMLVEPAPSMAPAPAAALAPAAAARPPATKTPFAIKIAAVGGVVSMLAGVTMVIYFIFFDRRPGDEEAAQPEARGAMAEMDRAASQGQGSADSPEAAGLDFSPMEVGLSPNGKPRAARPRTGSTAATPRRAPMDPAAAEKKRLLDLYGGTGAAKGAGNLPAAQQKVKRRTRTRNITDAEVHNLQRVNRRQIVACYNRALKRDYSLKDSRADVTLVVGTSGRVKRIRFSGISSETLSSCLRTNFKRWVFRPIGGVQDADVRFPLVFRGKGS